MTLRPPNSFSEETFTLPTPDDKKIYGILNKSTNPNGKVVVLSHGMTDHYHGYLAVIARNVFTAQGYDVVGFNYYAFENDARKLNECTIQTHADDLNLICNHFRPSYDKLCIAGHSYGGYAIIVANTGADALAFWDSSFVPYESFWKEHAPKLESTRFHIHGWGCYNLTNPAMIKLDQNTSEAGAVAMAQKITAPSLVVLAAESQENPVRTILYDSLACPKKLIDIDGANHMFTNGHTVYDLLDTTMEWFDAH
ncbi:MAG: alpha/beta hydrolase [Alphaproteobacteria bacterium]|nr:alpha/beta hydrolase [Alphaproteobacteria bacterium]